MRYELNGQSLEIFCQSFKEHRLINPLPILSEKNQRGETCKLFALSCLMDHVMAKPNPPKSRPPLYKNRLFTAPSLRKIAKDYTGSQVGEMYSVEALQTVAEESGFSLEAVQLTTVRAYIAYLKSLVEINKCAAVIFNVGIEGEDINFPTVNAEKYNEHSVMVLGYGIDRDDKTYFIIYSWGCCWLYDAEKLAHSALSLLDNCPVENFVKIGHRNGNRWVTTDYFSELTAKGIRQVMGTTERTSLPITSEQHSLRGVIFSMKERIPTDTLSLR